MKLLQGVKGGVKGAPQRVGATSCEADKGDRHGRGGAGESPGGVLPGGSKTRNGAVSEKQWIGHLVGGAAMDPLRTIGQGIDTCVGVTSWGFSIWRIRV